MRRSASFLQVEGRGTTTRAPVLRHRAERPGPCVVVAANVHGDECTGVAVAHRLDDWLHGALRCGSVVLYPSLNPAGLAARTRAVPPSGTDLNRLFPGRSGSGFADRLARSIWRDLAGYEPDFVVDLHADSSASIPYAIVDRAVSLRGRQRGDMDDRLDRLALSTGLTVVREYPDAEYVRFGLDRSLAGAVVNVLGVPAVTVEAGPRRFVDPDAVGAAFDAVRGVLAQAGLVDDGAPVHPTRVGDGPWRRAAAPRAGHDGLYVAEVRPGGRFSAGARLGRIHSASGEVLEDVTAPEDGVVLSWADASWVTAGGVVGTLAVADGGS